MKREFSPYFISDKTIYFTDRVEEVMIYEFERNELAKNICNLLNDTYNAAYQDGLAASFNEKNKEFEQIIINLSIENSRLKKQIIMNEK